MQVNAQDRIAVALRASDDPMTFSELKEATQLPSQDVRKALKSLLEGDLQVYVDGVEDGEKQYNIR